MVHIKRMVDDHGNDWLKDHRCFITSDREFLHRQGTSPFSAVSVWPLKLSSFLSALTWIRTRRFDVVEEQFAQRSSFIVVQIAAVKTRTRREGWVTVQRTLKDFLHSESHIHCPSLILLSLHPFPPIPHRFSLATLIYHMLASLFRFLSLSECLRRTLFVVATPSDLPCPPFVFGHLRKDEGNQPGWTRRSHSGARTAHSSSRLWIWAGAI